MTEKPDIDESLYEGCFRRRGPGEEDIPYFPLRSLDEAQSFSDGVVIIEGDEGRQIYVVCSASVVRCSAETLNLLLRDLDAVAWSGSEPNSAGVFYERLAIHPLTEGGMGGAIVSGDVWIHESFRELGLGAVIRDVIHNNRARVHDAE